MEPRRAAGRLGRCKKSVYFLKKVGSKRRVVGCLRSGPRQRLRFAFGQWPWFEPGQHPQFEFTKHLWFGPSQQLWSSPASSA